MVSKLLSRTAATVRDMPMDTAWALGQLAGFMIKHTEHAAASLSVAQGIWSPSSATPTDEVILRAQVVEQVLDQVLPHWRTEVPEDPHDRWGQHREAAVRAMAELQHGAEVCAKLGEEGLTLSAGGLHPWVWGGGARSLWASGHHAEAVAAAARQVNAEIENKVGRRDVSETDLLTQAFSDDDPAPGRPRLRLPGDDGGRTAKSVRRGIRSFAEGCYAAIRNPTAHEVVTEFTEQEALEQLAAFSVLARWVDSAHVVVP